MTHFAGLLLCFVYLTELLLALSHDIVALVSSAEMSEDCVSKFTCLARARD